MFYKSDIYLKEKLFIFYLKEKLFTFLIINSWLNNYIKQKKHLLNHIFEKKLVFNLKVNEIS